MSATEEKESLMPLAAASGRGTGSRNKKLKNENVETFYDDYQPIELSKILKNSSENAQDLQGPMLLNFLQP
jgi:hypothetical protein